MLKFWLIFAFCKIITGVEIKMSEENFTNLFPAENTPDAETVQEKLLNGAELRKSSKACSLPKNLIQEIANYQPIATKIINEIISGSFRGKTYKDLDYFVDRFGSRLAGTRNLENSINFLQAEMRKNGFDNVHGEDVQIPIWKRGPESAQLISPRNKKIQILGLGLSVGTPLEGILAPVIVVRSFAELKVRASEVVGKIVVFNEEFETYEVTVNYRLKGASEVAKLGGIAVLIRSVTPFSIGSPHTGMLEYEVNVFKIPAACITVADAQLFQQMQDHGSTLVIRLKMSPLNLGTTNSRNSVAEMKGSQLPEDVVIISGRADSWDVGKGAMDDGGGIFVTVEAMAVLRFLNLRPRRTLRAVLWTSEEFGPHGVKSYLKGHANEVDKIKAAFESDRGTFRPVGLGVAGTFEAGCIIREVLKLLRSINATRMRRVTGVLNTDIDEFTNLGVPTMGLDTQDSNYFYFHHTEKDTMAVENSTDLDLCTALWAVTSYVIADLSVALPRK